jgi:hypothetical protein
MWTQYLQDTKKHSVRVGSMWDADVEWSDADLAAGTLTWRAGSCDHVASYARARKPCPQLPLLRASCKRDDTCRTRYCYCCLPQGATYRTSQLHACLSYYAVCNSICPVICKRAIASRPSPSHKSGEHFHIYSVFGRSLCSNSIGFKYFRIGTFWQKISYDTNHLSSSFIFHLYFRFCVHRETQQNQKNSYMKNELRSGRLTTPTDIIRGTHLHQSCYEDVRIAMDDFPKSFCTILG